MNMDRKSEVLAGGLFVVATVASILGSVALGAILDGADYLDTVGDQQTRLVLAVLLFVVAAVAAVATAFVLFPILRRFAEGAAAGYVVLRVFENVLYVMGSVALLIMLTVGQSDAVGAAAAADATLLGVTLLAVHHWSVLIGTLIFAGMASCLLNYVLLQFRLVPRWLACWGLIGAALVVVYGLLGIFGAGSGFGSPLMLLAMPLAVQEMVFAGWLIVKGLTRPAAAPAGPRSVPAMR